jgi:citronellol/citronellal dehydrogenase
LTQLKDKTIFITGASRGIGKAIGLRAAADGANIVVIGKTDQPHPKLPGTVPSAVEDMKSAGGNALGCIADIRDEEQIAAAVASAVETFGGIDILVNNASAIFLAGTADTPAKRFDLMHGVNARGTFLTTQHCLPHLLKAENAHVLNISPPLNMNPNWFSNHVAYTMAKYGMSMCVLGMAEEFKRKKIAVNALWPRTAIATAAIANILGGEDMMKMCRKPEIMADAAHAIFNRDSATTTGNFFIDDEVLQEDGVTDMEQYAVTPGADLMPDFFLDVE